MEATPSITVTPIDFGSTALATPYALFYAKILDNVFTPAECRSLLSLVDGPSPVLSDDQPTGWSPAGLSTTATTQTVHTNFRNSDRALVVDKSMADFIYERLYPHVPELYHLLPGNSITGRPGKKQGPTWALAGVNPRLSFLRYGPGHYFKPHCDGLTDVEDKKSFVTLHIYLNDAEVADDGESELVSVNPGPVNLSLSELLSDSSETAPSPDHSQGSYDPLSNQHTPLRGGATRFWTPDKKAFLDVHPKSGRVLIFQQRMLVHSGEPVVAGVKYTVRSDFLFGSETHYLI